MSPRVATRERRPISTEPAESPRRNLVQVVSRLSWQRLSLPRVSVPRVSVPRPMLFLASWLRGLVRMSRAIDLRDSEAIAKPVRRSDAHPDGVHPKIARRREQVSRRSRRGRALLRWGSVGVAVLCTLVVATLFSPLVDLDHLTVQGLEGEPAAEVRDVSGLVPGTAMFGVRPSDVRRRVESLPWVAHADVDARWPDTVTVTVTPHRPLAVMQAAQGAPVGAHPGGRSVLTTSGVVLDAEDLGPVSAFAEELPVLSVDPSYAAPGGPEVAERHLSEVSRKVLGQLRPVVAGAVTELRMGAAGTVTLVARVPGGSSEAEFVLGDAEDLPAKAVALESLLSGAVELACLERVDVSVPTRVTILRSTGCTIPTSGEAAE